MPGPEAEARASAVVDYYERYWSEGFWADNPYERWKLDLVRSAARRLGSNARVLDVGCGDGWLLEELARSGLRCEGLDVSGEAVAIATRRGLRARRTDLDGTTLPVDDGSFDLVLCLDVLEHLFAPDRVMLELRRAVSPTGRVIIAVPNGLNLFNRLAFLSGRHVDVMDKAHLGGHPFSEHLRFFSRDVLERSLRDARLRPVSRDFFFPRQLTDGRFRAAPWLARAVTAPRLHQRMPSLFALAFLYECAPA
ncbi:MAG TPA: class I SAM-dependent methyltransferase [Polyangiaceae bacterium]